MKLTPKQDLFARLIALDGVNQSDAYRRAYDAGAMRPSTVHRNASALAVHDKVATRVAELRADARHAGLVDVKDLVTKLQEIAGAVTETPIRASDQIAALDKLAKLGGLYRDTSRDAPPAPITQITVILNHATGGGEGAHGPTVDGDVLGVDGDVQGVDGAAQGVDDDI
jgi:phage terminase small subunit